MTLLKFFFAEPSDTAWYDQSSRTTLVLSHRNVQPFWRMTLKEQNRMIAKNNGSVSLKVNR